MYDFWRSKLGLGSVSLVAGLALVLSGGATFAVGTEPTPKPRIDCSKRENQNKAACKNRNQELSDEELYFAGYWLARKGDYVKALHYLNQAQNKSDERILTYIGFATRKLGRVDEAFAFYARALEVNPNYTQARAYLGEAYIQLGDVAKARNELSEIASRCGVTCDEYKELDLALAKVQS